LYNVFVTHFLDNLIDWLFHLLPTLI